MKTNLRESVAEIYKVKKISEIEEQIKKIESTSMKAIKQQISDVNAELSVIETILQDKGASIDKIDRSLSRRSALETKMSHFEEQRRELRGQIRALRGEQAEHHRDLLNIIRAVIGKEMEIVRTDIERQIAAAVAPLEDYSQEINRIMDEYRHPEVDGTSSWGHWLYDTCAINLPENNNHLKI